MGGGGGGGGGWGGGGAGTNPVGGSEGGGVEGGGVQKNMGARGDLVVRGGGPGGSQLWVSGWRVEEGGLRSGRARGHLLGSGVGVGGVVLSTGEGGENKSAGCLCGGGGGLAGLWGVGLGRLGVNRELGRREARGVSNSGQAKWGGHGAGAKRVSRGAIPARSCGCNGETGGAAEIGSIKRGGPGRGGTDVRGPAGARQEGGWTKGGLQTSPEGARGRPKGGGGGVGGVVDVGCVGSG